MADLLNALESLIAFVHRRDVCRAAVLSPGGLGAENAGSDAQGQVVPTATQVWDGAESVLPSAAPIPERLTRTKGSVGLSKATTRAPSTSQFAPGCTSSRHPPVEGSGTSASQAVTVRVEAPQVEVPFTQRQSAPAESESPAVPPPGRSGGRGGPGVHRARGVHVLEVDLHDRGDRRLVVVDDRRHAGGGVVGGEVRVRTCEPRR